MTVLRVNTLAGIGSTTFGPVFGGNLEFNTQNYIVLPKGSSTQQGVLRDIPDVVGTGGTFYDNLVLAMPFNQATGLRDVSSRNRNPAAYGDVSISSTISKYYGSSAYFDGSGDYLSLESSQDWNFRGLNWTVECWIYYVSGTHIPIYTQLQSLDSNSNRLQLSINNISSGTGTWSTYAESSASAVLFDITQTASISTNTWTHVAFVRSGDTFSIFKDGSLVISNTDSDSLEDISRSSYIGVHRIGGALQYFNGHLQDLRVYKGLAKYTANFTPPDRIADVDVGFKPGALRYNTDSNLPELYDGNQWVQLSVSQVELGIGANTEPGARGVFGGGIEAGNVNTIEYINVSSTGNAQDFGDLVSARDSINSASSSTRGLFCGGGPSTNIIEYITISSTGNTQDFGDMTRATGHHFTTSNATRALNAGGPESASPTNIIDYVTIASTGNAVDFGDLTVARWGAGGGRSNSTRALFLAGYLSPSTGYNTIDFVTISTLGNAQDFGDALDGQYGSGAGNSSSKIRAFIAGGSSTIGPTPGANNVIQTVLFMTLGNATDFGDLSRYVRGTGSLSDSTRGVYGGGAPGYMNIIDYFLMSQSGNAVDFGDLTANRAFNPAGLSNAHGGL